jgi:GTPase
MTDNMQCNHVIPQKINPCKVIAIVGRPNVGKSTLFNFLTRTRNAIVLDEPGITRDRLYGEGKVGDIPYIVVDTGGVGSDNEVPHQYSVNETTAEVVGKSIINQTENQALLAAEEADCVIFLVDAHAGLMPDDAKMADHLRRLNKNAQKKIYLVVNKTDGLNSDTACLDFYQMGMGEPHPISASRGRGISSLIQHILENIQSDTEDNNVSYRDPSLHLNPGIRVAIIGRPNVGKSTLVNRILKEDRVLVADMPGTTRDSIFIPFEKNNQAYTLIDTAGIRRRARVNETVEKFSVIKSLQAIECSQVCVFLMDAQEGITDQDLHLIGFIIDAGKALVIGVNKWDELTGSEKTQVREGIERRLSFANFATIHFLSALRGTGVNSLFTSINKAYASATKTLSTPLLTRILESAVAAHEPPMHHARRIKLRYAHAGGQNPPIIVIHGNQTNSLPESYQRYLMSTFREALQLSGTPIRLELKSSENPYAGKHNILTPRQERKRKRLMTFYKTSKK